MFCSVRAKGEDRKSWKKVRQAGECERGLALRAEKTFETEQRGRGQGQKKYGKIRDVRIGSGWNLI
ncbi:MAG: hypothetical protein DBX39_01885 [Bacillota bacterium]|nr:MAG: hypothetical protein DBX39_01885 [Bacillota bacterium]